MKRGDDNVSSFLIMNKPEQTKIDNLVRHIDHVRNNCLLLGERLIGLKNPIGRMLIANGFIHDNSKFYGIEWEHLTDASGDPALTKLAIHHHNVSNPHHPEYWGTIDQMPQLYLCEAVCDWAARASEFGTSLQHWIDVGAAEKFDYKINSEIYCKIMYFSGLLLDKPFKPL
jgi:hypothetical protein